LLLPLCVKQSTTVRAVELYKIHNMVVWWATPVEIASALSRLLRMRQLDARERNEADKLAKKLADSWSVIQPSNKVRVAAMQLVNRYDLRAADSLQLAAALEWCENQAQGRIFLTTDHKLREAAMLSGFDVL
jgi:predicted nucleic acid-binding protein